MKTPSALIYVLLSLAYVASESVEEAAAPSNLRFTIEGRATNPYTVDHQWTLEAKVLVDGGRYVGFVKKDGSFVVNDVPSGSFMVDVICPKYVFDPVRLDVNSKGKMRARKLNHIAPAEVNQLPYPLRFKARALANYFTSREEWRVTDILFNPMVYMMLLPCLLLLVLPKMMNPKDPSMEEGLRALRGQQQGLPDMSEMLTNFFGGGSSASGTKKAAIKNAKKNR